MAGILLLSALEFQSLNYLNYVKKRTQLSYEKLHLLNELESQTALGIKEFSDILLLADGKEVKDLLNFQENILAILRQLKKASESEIEFEREEEVKEAGKEELKELAELADPVTRIFKDIVKALDSSIPEVERIRLYREIVENRYEGHLQPFLKLAIQNEFSEIQKIGQQIEKNKTSLIFYSWSTIGFILFVFFFAFRNTQKTIIEPIEELKNATSKLGEGNFDIELEVKNQDEIGVLAENFKSTVESLRWHYESMLKAKEDAIKSSQAKTHFLSRMSHELRTPMNAILGFGQLLNMDSAHPLSESQKTKVDEILKAGNHLLELINEVLDLSQIESGKITLSLEEVGFQEVLEELITLIRPLAKQKGIKVIRPKGQFSDLTVVADRTRLKQVLLNLFSNAVKYNRENGSIYVKIIEAGKDRVMISIIDTGMGISKENLDLLFDPFNRMGLEDSGIEGTGIGLNIAKQLIELMDGSIHVESIPDEGSRFSIELPKGKNRVPTETPT
ncbi:MAG: hypothetical protein NPINA01_23940 [Nitrospinaceae bacterium]|nr:MAG: hypothetical protein NPINA01_23940 [Nitrospinaceae bacterium]